MANVLTSWKEIAQYLGKAVRTVQRWEEEFGLPVRRVADSGRHAVLAIPEELDAWMRSRAEISSGAAFETLRSELAGLREETAHLRRRVEALEGRALSGVRRKRNAPRIKIRERN